MGFLTFFLTLIFIFNLHIMLGAQDNNLETYIVHVELPLDGPQPSLSSFLDDLQGWYHSFLPKTTNPSSNEEPHIIYSYHNVFTGFAVRLSPEQVKAMEKMPGFVSARPQKTMALHTTHSPNFLGLNQNTGFWNNSNYGRGVIIGVLDTGIKPDHPSFNDEGMPPPPAKWRGRCEFNTSSVCNNKLIGARFFTIGDGTPYDENGHGTHTASTAAGNFVRGANVFGNANGTAAGIAPLAHIAIYKVCQARCSESDILAAMDAAIDDGVDVLSLSLGGPARNFFDENVAVGAFSAMEKGIFVSCSAGNSGPTLGTIENGAPWVLTVGASTMDRKIRSTAVLGNDEQLDGESNYQPAGFASTFLPLIYPGMVSTDPNATFCFPRSLINVDVQGKVVLCDNGGGIGRIAKGRAVRNTGGAAMIIVNQQSQGYSISSESHILPATHLSYEDGLRVKAYLNSTTTPIATISFKGTVIGDTNAPTVSSFSARGPNRASPGILKPDIIGPGANILAAWHKSVENNTNMRLNFNIISGTSMSCPHLSGIAALLKNAHPDWSPAMIKSAIMTSADLVNLNRTLIQDQMLRPANVFATGSGHVNILKATNPGLVYDLTPADYLPYLCGLGYTNQQISYISNRFVTCSQISSIPEAELNYPSFFVVLGTAVLGRTTQTYSRTTTNVGDANSVYTVEVVGLSGIVMSVEPNVLQFSGLNQKLTYQVRFDRSPEVASNTIVQGFLTWTSANHSVRSPIVVSIL
ncbi:subtilisin-like protease [Henckelia pumila]|uniref:subtilisin-like protease n=1 Tax=Henckelia pumila TaxID=405737 RepID=UPI003C6E952D